MPHGRSLNSLLVQSDMTKSSRLVTFQPQQGRSKSYSMIDQRADEDEAAEADALYVPNNDSGIDDDDSSQGLGGIDDDEDDEEQQDKTEKAFRTGGWGRLIPFRSPLPSRKMVKQASLHRDSRFVEFNSSLPTPSENSPLLVENEEPPAPDQPLGGSDGDDDGDGSIGMVYAPDRIPEGTAVSNSGSSRRNDQTDDDSESSVDGMPSKKDRIRIATKFLTDYENGSPPSLPTDITQIDSRMLKLHDIKNSRIWRWILHVGLGSLILSSCYEGGPHPMLALGLNMLGIIIFSIDLGLLYQLNLPGKNSSMLHLSNHSYGSHGGPDGSSRFTARRFMQWWFLPMLVLVISLLAESIFVFVMYGGQGFHWFSVLKPIALFYVSAKARQALEALFLVFPIVIRVIILELLLILSFSAVAHQLFSEFVPFHNLAWSWVNLFECKWCIHG